MRYGWRWPHRPSISSMQGCERWRECCAPTKRISSRPNSSAPGHPRRSPDRPLRDKTLRLVGLDLIPFEEDTAPEFGIGVPLRPRRLETIDHDQHLLHFRPVPLQRHRIAARRPGIAETDHAADIF